MGRFNGGGFVSGYRWDSANTFVTTNNGIANVGSNSGLNILNAGIYKLDVSLYPVSTGDGGQFNTIYFSFGTTYLNNASTPSGTFGGSKTLDTYSYTTTYPGIISWLTNAFSSANSTTSELDTTSGYLVYKYYSKSNNSGELYSGICTTQITFTINAPTIIYFNVACSVGISVGNSYFVLQMISSQYV